MKPDETKMADDGEKSVFVLVSNVMENTAAHGIPNIKRAGNSVRRVVWAMLFLFGFTMFAIQATKLITKYVSFDVDINFKVDYASRTAFPAVTVCNMNPIMSSYLAGNDDLFSLFRGGPALSGANANASGEGVAGASTWMARSSTTATPAPTTDSGDERYFDWDDTDYENDGFGNVLIARDIIAELPYEQRRESGHELTDMLLACSFSGYPCSPGNFTHFYNYQYGNCFTFNGGDSSKSLFTTKVGPLYGLSMEFNVDQGEYEQDLQPAAGIRVTIHDKDVMPFPEDNGVSISPGQETSIGMGKRMVTHVPTPYTNCTEIDDILPDNVFLRQFPWIKYTRDTCEKNCLYYEILHQCNCSDPRYRYNISDGYTCLYARNDQWECLLRVETQYVHGKLTQACECTSPCVAISYEPTVSAALWPNSKYMYDVVESIENTEELHEDYIGNHNFVENNFAKVMVFFDELTYEHVYDTEKYLWFDLLSDMGGQFGLWVGVSVLTVFEFVELTYDIVMVLFNKCRHVSERNKTGVNGGK